jgi:hypothetical protein
MKNKRILVISDLHFPFAHKDWHGFLTKLKLNINQIQL